MNVLNPESKISLTAGKTPVTIEVSHPSVSGLKGRLKRALDVIGAGLLLLFLSPLMVVVALAVRVQDRGPALYRQKRVGLGGQVFTLVKFRTMDANAEDGRGPIWSTSNDPRCTRLGALLRRSGFDELPQLWNVVKGDMSLVGPRPERPEFVGTFRVQHRGYELRHSVNPGLTGYAQVHGWHGNTDIGQRLRHDLYYVHNWSPTLDFRVLSLTVLQGWSDKTRNGVPA